MVARNRNAPDLAKKTEGHGRAIEGVRYWLNFELAGPIVLLEPIEHQIGRLCGELPLAPATTISVTQ